MKGMTFVWRMSASVRVFQLAGTVILLPGGCAGDRLFSSWEAVILLPSGCTGKGLVEVDVDVEGGVAVREVVVVELAGVGVGARAVDEELVLDSGLAELALML